MSGEGESRGKPTLVPGCSESPSEVADNRVEEVGPGGDVDGRPEGEKAKERRVVQWDSRPAFGSSEWLRYFEEVVKTSKTRNEAVRRLGYANPSVIYYHLKKFGMERPPEWNLKPAVSRQRRGRVPDVVLKSDVDRAWIACLTQGEGCIKTHYSKKTNSTAIEIGVNMTDPQPVFRFSDLVGVHRPKKAKPREGDLKPAWYTVVGGLRAYRVLQEIVPFLLGQKLEEAKRSLEALRTGRVPRRLFRRV